jgi:VanZ family protein
MTGSSIAERQVLHYWRFWAAVGWLLIGLVVYLSLTPALPDLPEVDHGDKLGHFLAYAALMGWFAQLYRTRRAHLRIAVRLVLLGVGLELVQGMTGYRSFEAADIAANSAGVAAAWLIAQTPLGGSLAWLERRVAVQAKLQKVRQGRGRRKGDDGRGGR